jgi:PAS domain S-box-containing protein
MLSHGRPVRRRIPDQIDPKHSEEARQISERRFDQFFATLPDYCYMISPSGHVLDINPAACEALGYAKEELVGKPISVLYAPESHEKMLNLLERWKKAEKLADEEMVIVTKQGQKRTVLLNMRSVVDAEGKLLHSTSVQVDITERKRIEEKLRESQVRLAASIAAAMDAIEGYAPPLAAMAQEPNSGDPLQTQRQKLHSLTKREREILHFLVSGVSTRRISELLDVRPSTVRNHVQNLFSKLGAHSRLECVALAHRLGFDRERRLSH